MPDTPSMTSVKKFTYRGAVEEFSNTYHFSGTMPTTDAGWLALWNALWQEERKIFHDGVTAAAFYGYEAGNDNSVYQADTLTSGYPATAGNITVGTGIKVPGDVASTVRWYTGESSSRGKRIYCRKYFHGTLQDPAAPDNVYSVMKTALDTFGAAMIAGTLPGSVKYCGPQGAVLSLPAASPYLTTRTLKRRGKRPPTS